MPELGRLKWEGCGLKLCLSYIVSVRPAWATFGAISEQSFTIYFKIDINWINKKTSIRNGWKDEVQLMLRTQTLEAD